MACRPVAGKPSFSTANRKLARMQDEFISTISHELRTPLGFIKGYVTTLLRQDTDWDIEARKEFLRIIDDEADRLRDLIDNLLDSSRLETGTLSMTLDPVRIEQVIRDVASRTKSMYPDIKLKLEQTERLPLVEIDATRIAQVLDNLLSNAYKYAPESDVTVRVTQHDDRLLIEVEDNGPGIPTEHTSRLFERFYRVPENSTGVRGTGLGLYICRKIIEAHGGEVGVKTTLGVGSRFYFTLPISPLTIKTTPEVDDESGHNHSRR